MGNKVCKIERLSTVSIGLFFILNVNSVRFGDRHFGHEKGLFYSFGTDISIIDPSQATVIKSIKGATSWGDVVYIRDLAQIRKYIFANNRETNELWVIDTVKQEIIATIKIGEKPVHVYAIESREEVWTHLDGDGDFDIVHLADAKYLLHDSLKAHIKEPGHGKLLFDPNLANKGFATNMGEPFLFQLDLQEKKIDTKLSLENPIDGTYGCSRTHGIAYSPINDHLFVECSDPISCSLDDYTDASICSGSIWEIDVKTFSSVKRFISPALNAQHGNNFGMKGQIYASPDEKFILATNPYNNYIHFLKPNEQGETETFEVPVNHNPGNIAFYPKDGSAWGPETHFKDYVLFIALEDIDSSSSGVAYIDCEDVYNAWNDQMQDVPVNYLPVGAGNIYRPIIRGGNYIATPSDFDGKHYQSLILIDAIRKQKIRKIAGAGSLRIAYAPFHTDDLAYQVDQFGIFLEKQNNLLYVLSFSSLAFACIAIILASSAWCLSIRNFREHVPVMERGIELAGSEKVFLLDEEESSKKH